MNPNIKKKNTIKQCENSDQLNKKIILFIIQRKCYRPPVERAVIKMIDAYCTNSSLNSWLKRPFIQRYT